MALIIMSPSAAIAVGTFVQAGDYAPYPDLLAQTADKAEPRVGAYRLLPNHVHIFVGPADEDGLRRSFADAHWLHRLY